MQLLSVYIQIICDDAGRVITADLDMFNHFLSSQTDSDRAFSKLKLLDQEIAAWISPPSLSLSLSLSLHTHTHTKFLLIKIFSLARYSCALHLNYLN